MGNRAGRRAQNRATGKYRPARGLAYNEFVGELGPSSGDAHTELHVRYGARDGLYLDWSISLWLRTGGIEEIRRTGHAVERRRLETIEVHGSTIRHVVFNPGDLATAPIITVLEHLNAEDEAKVNAAYDSHMQGLSYSWAAKHDAFGRTDRHTVATFGFAQRERDPAFRADGLDWVLNTVICIESDEADEAISDRVSFFFKGRTSTAGVLRVADDRMQFIAMGIPRGPGEPLPARDPASSEPIVATGLVNMGMLVDSIYADKDWTDGVESLLGG